ncbi:hypothetical protein ACI0X9_003295 [Cronobacter turicensis]
MITVTLQKQMEEAVSHKSKTEKCSGTEIYNRWAMLGKLAEEHPHMMTGDLVAYLKEGEYPSTLLTDAPAQPGCSESENASVRMMMKVLIYALKQRCPEHHSIGRAMDLMKRLGMSHMTDVLR